MPYFVYFLRCRGNSLYCGYTKDLKKRLISHNKGIASKYTRSRRPVRLVYFEECASLSSALKREYALKQLSKKEKEVLVKGKLSKKEKEIII